MADKTVLKAIRYLGKCLEDDGLVILKMILFGSQVDGTARADSDIDIVIISNDFEGKDIFERAVMLRSARMKNIDRYLFPMDIILKTPGEYDGGLIALYADIGMIVFKSRHKSWRKSHNLQ